MRRPNYFRPGGKNAESLDELPVVCRSVTEAAGAIDDQFDVDAEVAAAGFTKEQRRFLEQTEGQERTQKEAGTALRWSPAKTERIRKQCDRQIAKNPAKPRPTIRRPRGASFFERLPSGHGVWTLSTVSEIEREIIERERFISRSKS